MSSQVHALVCSSNMHNDGLFLQALDVLRLYFRSSSHEASCSLKYVDWWSRLFPRCKGFVCLVRTVYVAQFLGPVVTGAQEILTNHIF